MFHAKTFGGALILAVLALMSAAQPGYGHHGSIVVHPLPLQPTSPVATATPAESTVIFMPILVRPPEVRLQFASQVQDDGTPIDPASTFGYGIVRLYISGLIEGAASQQYRLEWTIDGQRRAGLDDEGVVGAQTRLISYPICLVTVGSNVCNGKPLNRGSYQVQLVLNDLPYGQVTAVIE